MIAKKLNCKQVQWLLYLARFNFILHHCLDKSMNKPNTLYKRLDYGNGLHDNENIVLLKPKYSAVHTLEELAFKDEKYSLLMNICQRKRIEQQEKPVVCTARELCQYIFRLVQASEWFETNGLLFFQKKIYIPDIMNFLSPS